MDPAMRMPLHYSALTDDVEVVQSLLDAGADPNVVDMQGFTPLHLAAQSYAIASATKLLNAGADANALNLWGNGPLFVAVFNSQGRGDMIRLLRDCGADPGLVNKSGQTPLGLARLIDNYEVAQYFEDVTD